MRRRIDVETTSCVYWENKSIKTRQNKLQNRTIYVKKVR